MKYFIDTEFIEGFHKPLFGKKRHFIDLISIGIVAEDGREYYAISNEYKYKDADEWVQKNVIIPMYIDVVHGDDRNRFTAANFQKFYGKSNKQIATEIMLFVWADAWNEWMGGSDEFFERGKKHGWNTEPIEFYGYYADYDWVLLCSLFGRMIDLPEGFPMYCRDLKQMFDEAVFKYCLQEQHLIEAAEKKLKLLPNYPKQTNEHNALADAKWNYELYKFLKSC